MFQFSIRKLLWITLVAALVMAWVADHRRQDAARETVEKARKAAEREAQFNAEQWARVQGEINHQVFPNPEATPHTLELPIPTLDVY